MGGQGSANLESPLTPWTPAVPAGQQAAAAPVQPPGTQPAAGQAQAAQEAQQEAPQQAQQDQGGPSAEQRELELQLYADFLRIVLEVSCLVWGCCVTMPWGLLTRLDSF